MSIDKKLKEMETKHKPILNVISRSSDDIELQTNLRIKLLERLSDEYGKDQDISKLCLWFNLALKDLNMAKNSLKKIKKAEKFYNKRESQQTVPYQIFESTKARLDKIMNANRLKGHNETIDFLFKYHDTLNNEILKEFVKPISIENYNLEIQEFEKSKNDIFSFNYNLINTFYVLRGITKNVKFGKEFEDYIITKIGEYRTDNENKKSIRISYKNRYLIQMIENSTDLHCRRLDDAINYLVIIYEKE